MRDGIDPMQRNVQIYQDSTELNRKAIVKRRDTPPMLLLSILSPIDVTELVLDIISFSNTLRRRKDQMVRRLQEGRFTLEL